MSKFWALVVATAGLTLAFAGCSSTLKPPGESVEGELANAPSWVRQGCTGYWEKESERKICGVGSVGSTRNAGLARSGAISRARTEIARTLNVEVEAMVKDYQATTTGGERFGSAAADDQHLEDVSRQITEATLSGTQLVDSWISESGTFYALVALDIEQFKGAVAQMKNLAESVRTAVIQRADRAFEDLDRQIEKRHEE